MRPRLLSGVVQQSLPDLAGAISSRAGFVAGVPGGPLAERASATRSRRAIDRGGAVTPDWLAWRLMYLRRVARERPFWTGTLGWPAYLTLALAPLCGPLEKAPLRPIRLRGYRRPFYYRVGTSDLWVIRQVFALGEYECVGSEPDVRYIID